MAILERYRAHLPSPDPSINIAEGKTGSGVRVKVYAPPDVSSAQPAVCYFHGEGFVLGRVDRDDALVSRFAQQTGLVFVSVEYRLADIPLGFKTASMPPCGAWTVQPF